MNVHSESSRPRNRAVRPAVAMRSFCHIVEDSWDIESDDARTLLGRPPKSTYYAWKSKALEDPNAPIRLTRDHLERISHVLGIYKALQILFPQHALADEWMRRPNRAFGDRSPLQHALGGNVTDLADVRRYLDAARGGI